MSDDLADDKDLQRQCGKLYAQGLPTFNTFFASHLGALLFSLATIGNALDEVLF